MANNCLVTKLKSVVENSNLSILGELIIKVSSPGGIHMRLSSETSQNIVVKSPNGTVVETINLPAQSGDAYTEVSRSDISSYEYLNFIIPDKYNFKILACWSGYSTGHANATYEIKDRKGSDLDFMTKLSSCSVNADYTVNENYYNLPNLKYFSPDDSIININQFCKCKNLYTTNFGSTTKSTITGKLNKFFEDMCKDGRTSESYSMTYNGNVGGKLYWNETLLTLGWTISCEFNSSGCIITKQSGSFPYSTITYNKSTDTWS